MPPPRSLGGWTERGAWPLACPAARLPSDDGMFVLATLAVCLASVRQGSDDWNERVHVPLEPAPSVTLGTSPIEGTEGRRGQRGITRMVAEETVTSLFHSMGSRA